MSGREVRCSEIPEEWKTRLDRRACPVCGKDRKDFDGRHRGYQLDRQYAIEHGRDPETWYGGTPCCCSDCTSTYWAAKKTWQDHRRKLFNERNGICAACGRHLVTYPHPNKSVPHIEEWTLDHILPIALGGSMWDPENHQILCDACNKVKTAQDLGDIAAWKRMQKVQLPDLTVLMREYRAIPSTQQKTLF